MEFIQCRDSLDLEKTLKKGVGGFVSKDFRIYESIEFWDNECSWEISSKEFLEVSDFLSQVRMMSDGSLETSFKDLSYHSIELQNCFNKIVETLKLKRTK